MDLIVNEELRSLIPPLTDDEKATLEKSILDEGIRDALVVWAGTIVDGHNRYEIATKHGIDFETRELRFKSVDDAKVWMIDNQQGRRNLTTAQKLELGWKRAELLEEKAKENLSKGGGDKKSEDYKSGFQKSEKAIEPINTTAEAARFAGVSTDTASKYRQVVSSDDEETKRKLASGELSINKAYETVKRPHVSNNSGENEWYTPKYIIDAARRAMGTIDFDPASCELANETVLASEYCTKDDSGLEIDWAGNVWLNPPYAQPLIMQFCEKVVEQKDNYKQAIILINNATETAWFRKLISVASAVCFTNGRVKFIDKAGNPTGAPLQGQALVYVGYDSYSFSQAFKEIGWTAKIEEL